MIFFKGFTLLLLLLIENIIVQINLILMLRSAVAKNQAGAKDDFFIFSERVTQNKLNS